MSRLITTSLQSSIDWYKVCPPSWKKKAYTDLKNMLARVPYEPSEAAKLGIAFEETLYRFINSSNSSGSEQFQKIVKRYRDYKQGGPLGIQKTMKRFITLSDVEYCLYGKLDIHCGNFIEDIKTTSKVMDDYSSKYLNGFQHHMYCYITEVPVFRYFIVAFNEDTRQIRTTQEIEYKVKSFIEEQAIVFDEIKKIFRFFNENPELGHLYNDKYCLY